MSTVTFIHLYAIAIPIFFIIDMVWLGWLAKNFYQTKLGYLLGEVNWVAAIVFYLIFLVGLTYFAIYPGVQAGAVGQAVFLGMLFGFFTYATYNLTNLATIRDWPLLVSLVDMAWGAFLGALVSGLTAYIYLSLS